MRRPILLIYMAVTLALLAGCQYNPFSNRRDIERLRPIQTMGFDRRQTGIVVSISSGIGPRDASPLVMKSVGSGIETAIARLQDYSPEDELFYAHVRYILLGESMAADSITPLLDWVERSPAMRTGTALFVVRGDADDAVTGAAGEDTDITQRLSSLEREEAVRGRHVFTLREVASALTERGSALCLAVRALPSDNTIFTGSKTADAIVPAGYAVLQDGAVSAFLTYDETLGAELLTGSAVGAQLMVDGNIMELFEASADAAGQWDEDGTLTGLHIRGTLKAGIREREKDGEEDMEVLQKDLQAAALACLEGVIAHSQAMGCDFLDLHSAAAATIPGHRYSRIANWEDIFPGLPVTVEVEGEISRSYDLSN